MYKSIVAVFLLLLLSGCGLGSVQKGRKPSPDWSRGLPVGLSVSGTLGMAVEGEGDRVHLVWPTEIENRAGIHYQQLDDTAVSVVDRPLELPSGQSRTPRLLLADTGELHLFWASRPTTNEPWRLWHAMLDENGNVASSPMPLSPEEMNVGTYVVAPDPTAGGVVVWDDVSAGGLYATQLQGTAVSAELTIITPSGESPTARFDSAGILHLAWRDEARILYATFPGSEFEPSEGTQIVDLDIGPGDSVDGPVLGLAGERAYVLWSVFSQSGLEAGTSRTAYVSFPPASPALSVAERIYISPVEDHTYQAYQGNYPLTQLVPPLLSPGASSDYVAEPAVAASQGNELAAVVALNQAFRQQTAIQMAVVLLEEGEVKGYQMAAKTETFSQDAVLTADNAGHLHLVWREGSRGQRAYYATTAPEARSVIDRLSIDDALNAFLTGGLEATAGILLFPLAALWLIPGGILLGLWRMTRDFETMAEISSRVLLILAIGLYQVTKLLFLPTILSYVPFSAWLDIPVAWREAFIVGVPVLIFVLALTAAEWRRRKRPDTSSFLYYVVVAGVDAILTLAVYGVNLMGVF